MFSFCKENIPGIKFHFFAKEKVLEAKGFLAERFQTSRTIKGTQRYHRFIPQPTATLAVYEISFSKKTAIVSVVESLLIDTSDVTTNSYIACMYEGKVWFEIVEVRSEEFGDFSLSSCIQVVALRGLFSLKKIIHAEFVKMISSVELNLPI